MDREIVIYRAHGPRRDGGGIHVFSRDEQEVRTKYVAAGGLGEPTIDSKTESEIEEILSKARAANTHVPPEAIAEGQRLWKEHTG